METADAAQFVSRAPNCGINERFQASLLHTVSFRTILSLRRGCLVVARSSIDCALDPSTSNEFAQRERGSSARYEAHYIAHSTRGSRWLGSYRSNFAHRQAPPGEGRSSMNSAAHERGGAGRTRGMC